MGVVFDTLEAVEGLKASGFTEAQARGISFVLKSVQEDSVRNLVTKADLREETGKLREEMLRMEGRLTERMATFEGNLKSLRLEMKIFFLIIIIVMLLTNPAAISIASRLLTLVK